MYTPALRQASPPSASDGKSAASKAVDNRAKRCLDELEQGSDQGLARSYFRVNPDVGTAG